MINLLRRVLFAAGLRIIKHAATLRDAGDTRLFRHAGTVLIRWSTARVGRHQ